MRFQWNLVLMWLSGLLRVHALRTLHPDRLGLRSYWRNRGADGKLGDHIVPIPHAESMLFLT